MKVRNLLKNEFGLPIGFPLQNWKPALVPPRAPMVGSWCRLEPINPKKHAHDLFNAFLDDFEGRNWSYLPYGPFDTTDDFDAWIQNTCLSADPFFHVIIDTRSNKALGVASYLRINPTMGVIEVGHINYSPLLQNTTEGTEAMFLMMKWAFENGYRRYEWKCNALNIKSRNAAQRLGLSYEGVFRQIGIKKGRNRNTAWFAAIDKEWEDLKKCFENYLSDDNFDERKLPKVSLSSLTKPILYKVDNLEFS